MTTITPLEQRRIRLGNDYGTMENIRRPWLKWRPLRGAPPFVEQYELELQLRTIVSSKPAYRDNHVIQITLGADYPVSSAPIVQMITKPFAFHPNWFPSSGRWCYGTWLVYESLGAHVVRMIQTLQYNEDITNEHSAANGEARAWYLANRSRGLFPCDRTPLPDPTGTAQQATLKKKFQIKA